jgi:AbrB family looped-hinge helix DNA binding protein
MDALAGPTPIAKNGQITLPKHVLENLGWAAGDMVMIRLSDEDPEVLNVVPVAVCLRRYRRGDEAEKMLRLMSGHESRVTEEPPPNATK